MICGDRISVYNPWSTNHTPVVRAYHIYRTIAHNLRYYIKVTQHVHEIREGDLWQIRIHNSALDLVRSYGYDGGDADSIYKTIIDDIGDLNPIEDDICIFKFPLELLKSDATGYISPDYVTDGFMIVEPRNFSIAEKVTAVGIFQEPLVKDKYRLVGYTFGGILLEDTSGGVSYDDNKRIQKSLELVHGGYGRVGMYNSREEAVIALQELFQLSKRGIIPGRTQVETLFQFEKPEKRNTELDDIIEGILVVTKQI